MNNSWIHARLGAGWASKVTKFTVQNRTIFIFCLRSPVSFSGCDPGESDLFHILCNDGWEFILLSKTIRVSVRLILTYTRNINPGLFLFILFIPFASGSSNWCVQGTYLHHYAYAICSTVQQNHVGQYDPDPWDRQQHCLGQRVGVGRWSSTVAIVA